MSLFLNRQDAGQRLSEVLKAYSNQPDTLILGMPRGGVVVAKEVAQKLHLPLDIVVSRKIAPPGNPEFAIGAIDETGEGIWDETTIKMLGISSEYLKKTIEKEKTEAKRRSMLYRSGRKPLTIKGKTVLLIDDGIATGLTMRAAIRSVKKKGAARVIVAVPVIASDSILKIKNETDELIYLDAPDYFGAVAQFYDQFEQTSDEEVIEIMASLPKSTTISPSSSNASESTQNPHP